MKALLAVTVLMTTVFFDRDVLARETGGMDWKIAPYLWTVGMDGTMTIGDLEQEVDMSFSDILSDFEVGGSVFAEFGKDNHAVHFDYTYIRLRPDPTPLPSPPFEPESELASKLTINIFETAYNYRWKGAEGPSLVLGARLMDIKMRMTPGDLPAVSTGPDWWDYFVGVKTHNAISTNWDFDFYGTIGTGGSDLPWTLQAMFGRRFSNDNRLGLGLRIWGVDYSSGSGIMGGYTELDTTFYGLMLGYEFN
jgi:hypothetical protein